MYVTFTDRFTRFGNLKHFPCDVPESRELYAKEQQNCLLPFARLSHTLPLSSVCLILQWVVSPDGATRTGSITSPQQHKN